MYNQSNHKAKFLMADLFQGVTSQIRTKSQNCKVFKIKYKHISKTRLILLVKCFEEYSDPKGHFVSLALQIKKEDHKRLKSKRLAVLSIPMKVYCSCPAYKFWGSKYIATKEVYNINTKGKELRPPKIRDPLLKNIVCKHITATAKALKSQSISKALKGKSKQGIECSAEHILYEEIEDLPEMSVSECQELMLQQGVSLDVVLTELNFEEVMQTVLNQEVI